MKPTSLEISVRNICYIFTGQFKQWPHGETPLDFLDNASHCFACAIKGKPKDAALHMKLGQVLEERYYAEDLFGLKKEVTSMILLHNLPDFFYFFKTFYRTSFEDIKLQDIFKQILCMTCHYLQTYLFFLMTEIM